MVLYVFVLQYPTQLLIDNKLNYFPQVESVLLMIASDVPVLFLTHRLFSSLFFS